MQTHQQSIKFSLYLQILDKNRTFLLGQLILGVLDNKNKISFQHLIKTKAAH